MKSQLRQLRKAIQIQEIVLKNMKQALKNIETENRMKGGIKKEKCKN